MGLKVYSLVTFHICSLMQCDLLAPASMLIPSLWWQTHAVTDTPYDIDHDKLCPFISVSQNKPFFPLAAFTRSPSMCVCLHVHSHVCTPVCIWMCMHVCRTEVNLSCHLLDTENFGFELTWEPPGRYITAQRYSKISLTSKWIFGINYTPDTSRVLISITCTIRMRTPWGGDMLVKSLLFKHEEALSVIPQNPCIKSICGATWTWDPNTEEMSLLMWCQLYGMKMFLSEMFLIFSIFPLQNIMEWGHV